MALLKKCSLCPEKGLFLKLTNGLCDKCKTTVDTLENEYTKLLQQLALNPNNKISIAQDLNSLILKAEPFDGISNISISNYKNLLNSISKVELQPITPNPLLAENTSNESTLRSNNTNNLNNITTTTINPVSTTQIKKSLKLKINSNFINEKTQDIISNIPTVEKPQDITSNIQTVENLQEIAHTTSITKIKNLIEPLNSTENLNTVSTKNTPKILNLKLNSRPSSLAKKNSSTINLHSKVNKKELENKINSTLSSTLESTSIKDAFIINNLKKKCSILASKLDSPNTSLDSIAETYFYIKNELLPNLENTNKDLLNNNPIILKSLENTKNTLCIRCKKSEDELFDFFNYVTIFVQTTGLSPNNSDIIEISATKISYGKIIDEFYTLVNPIKSIKLAVTNSTGISNKDVEDKPTIDMIIPTLMNFIDNYQLVAFNSKPIELFINSTLKKLNMSLIEKNIISSMSLYRIRYKNYHGHPPALSDISSACLDLLPNTDIKYIDEFKSHSLSNSHAIYKLYEVLKYKYR